MSVLRRAYLALTAAFTGMALVAPAGATVANLDFNRDVMPILASNCYKCHGPDGKERKGGTKDRALRLDIAEGAYANYGGPIPIVPGHLEKSEMIARITSSDPEQMMPPKKSGKNLTAQQIETLKLWVTQGAPYASHWSYVKPVRPPMPLVVDKAWPKNSLDFFILARLEKEGLKPQVEADRYTLARRLSLDITGLPPTVEEVDEFVNDKSESAYESLVDRLLARPTYGEHWARIWLDLARYADSSGYASDTPRTIWGFRDYVINSFNHNKPFDQFTIEQIAGDLLPDATQEQIIATAFHRNTMTNTEGGTTREEWRNAAIIDRVNTTMSVWMGTSFACAQCHDHKYDPLPQKDYFRLFAILNNTQDADKPDEEPTLKFYSSSQSEQRSKLEGEIAALETKLKTPTPELLARQGKWEADFPLDLQWQSPAPTSMKSSGVAAFTPASDGSVVVTKRQKTDTYTIELPFSGAKLSAIRLESLPPEMKTARRGATAVVISRIRASIVPPAAEDATISIARHPAKPISFAVAHADAEPAGYDLQAVLHDPAPKPKKAAKPSKAVAKPGWSIADSEFHSLTLTTAAPVSLAEGSKVQVTIEQISDGTSDTLSHFRLSMTDDSRAEEFSRTPASIVTVLAINSEKRSATQQETLSHYYVANEAPELKTERLRLPVVKRQLEDMKPITVPIMKELPANQQRQTFIQHRGNYLSLGDEVKPGVPSAFPPLPAGVAADRLSLAKWLVDDNNPLTARVIANRYWEQIFGIGIVRTSEEFGVQGEPPSHPELLDFLAVELVREKWDMKKFIKLLVTSATYRQSSKVTPELFGRDPDNRLLAHGARFRMSAEMVRDQALAVSGLLSPKMFGPSVRPPRPSAGLTAAFGGGLDWDASPGEDKFRRAVYTEVRRTSPYPSANTFDAPSREICTLRRVRTNTPLQALVTLNDPVYMEAAQALARKMVSAGKSPREIIAAGFRACVARPPHDVEIDRLTKLHDETRDELAKDPKSATDLATIPIGPLPRGADAADMAAWTTIANVLLNLDETLMRR